MVKFVALWIGNLPEVSKLCLHSFKKINKKHQLDIYIIDCNNLDKFENEYKETNINFIKVNRFEDLIDNSEYNKYKTEKIVPQLPYNYQANLAYRGDIFRTLMLANSKEPICYIDLDIYFIKSLDEFFEKYETFTYNWDNQKDPYCANTAVLYSNGTSKVRSIYHNILINSNPLPRIGYSYKNKHMSKITILDKKLFDFFWCGEYPEIHNYIVNTLGERNFKIVFKSHPNSKIIADYLKNNCYIYHWHNNWDTKIVDNSVAYWLAKDCELIN